LPVGNRSLSVGQSAEGMEQSAKRIKLEGQKA